MQVLLAQLEPAEGAPHANAGAVAGVVAEHPEADLAVFPELFLTGYDLGRAEDEALATDSEPLLTVREAARARCTAVLVGFAERTEHGVANSVACIDADGRLLGSYRKTHLFGAAEEAVFVAGDELNPVELAGRRVGPMICFDMEFPEPARALSRAGCELLVTVAANMTPYEADHAIAARARALDNRRPHVYVNRVGAQSGLRFEGGSMAIDAAGMPIAELGADAELRCVEIDERTALEDADVDYLSQLRDDLVVEHLSTTNAQGGIR